MSADVADSHADGRSIEVVHDHLRKAILNGELGPGEELSQVQLAKGLGVSRSPLREALRLLQREGLVQAEPNRKMRVAGVSLPAMEETYMARITLESLAVRLTVPQLDMEAFAQLEGDMTRMSYFAAEGDFDLWEVPHRAFHSRIVAGGGERLVRLIAQLSDHCERYRRLHSAEPRVLESVQQEHRRILEACKAKDPDEGAASLVDHLSRVVFDIIDLVDATYDPVRLRLAVAMAEAPVTACASSEEPS